MYLTKIIFILVLVTPLVYSSGCVRPNEVITKKSCELKCEGESYKSRCTYWVVKTGKGYCQCKEGTARDITETCIPSKECKNRAKKICGKNEEWLCGNACYFECIEDPSPCPDYRECIDGCYCIKDHLRNKYGNCVKEDLC